jgi:predicted phosphodiesterase
VRYLILSDIHANREALEAVMETAAADEFDAIVCCGDVVGYGADPNAATEWTRENVKYVVRGNHDKACAGLEDLEWFNPAARISAEWTLRTLEEANAQYLKLLPRGPIEVNGFQILHGSPVDEDEYLIAAAEASMVSGYLDARVSFFGHTHLQGGFWFHRSGIRRLDPVARNENELELLLDSDSFYLINPGSVGQPRDGDPRAAWAYYEPDHRRVVYRRVDYDVPAAQAKIRDAGLPEVLARRLAFGQ